MQDFEIRAGCGLNRWLGSIPSSWLPDESIVCSHACCLPLSSAAAGADTSAGLREWGQTMCALSDLISAVRSAGTASELGLPLGWSVPLGLDSLGRKWVSVLGQCAVKQACGRLACSLFIKHQLCRKGIFRNVLWSGNQCQTARLNPYGTHCGTSRPDVVFPATEVLPWYWTWTYPLTYLPRLKTLLLLPTVFIFQFSRLLCFRFFPPCRSFSSKFSILNLALTQQVIWFLFHHQSPSLACSLLSLNWYGMASVRFKMKPWSLEPPASIFI